MVALHGTAHHVETLVRQFRRVREVEELSHEARQQANRRLSYHFDEDGSLVVKAPARPCPLAAPMRSACWPRAS